MKTPVAFLIFNRPDTTAQVFAAIRQAKPPKLLIVADGPRANYSGETDKCQAARAIIDSVDWDCQVMMNYSDVNLGCKQRVSSGLDWVFANVEEAIILEDDCVPHQSFFPYCEELLDCYRGDQRIMGISGDNFQFGRRRTKYSYYFSRFSLCWGWATWRRAWQHYDVEMKLWPEIQEEHWLEYILEKPSTLKQWRKIFASTYKETINSWAFRWTFACWVQNGLTILPNCNLVSNIGFATEGTNTVDSKNKFAKMPVEEISFPLKHPPFVIRHAQADDFTQQEMFERSLLTRASNKAKKILGF